MTTNFFKRTTQNIHGLEENQLIEAFALYEEKIKNEIIQEVEKEYGVAFDDENVRNLIRTFITKAMKKGMELSLNTSLVTDHYKEAKEMENDKRIGVLDKTTGKFYECDYGSHWKMIQEILKNEYPYKYEKLQFYIKESLFNDPKREELDFFILENFELKGATFPIQKYLETE